MAPIRYAVDNSPQRPHYITTDDAADILRVTQRTIYNLVNSGRLTGYRLGPRILRVDLHEIDAVMQTKNAPKGFSS